jgi:5-dehydro-2-deoxygluconokinase
MARWVSCGEAITMASTRVRDQRAPVVRSRGQSRKPCGSVRPRRPCWRRPSPAGAAAACRTPRPRRPSRPHGPCPCSRRRRSRCRCPAWPFTIRKIRLQPVAKDISSSNGMPQRALRERHCRAGAMARNWPIALSRKRFLVIGRAGMDLYPDPPGTRTEDATDFVGTWRLLCQHRVALARQGMDRPRCSPACRMMPSGASVSINSTAMGSTGRHVRPWAARRATPSRCRRRGRGSSIGDLPQRRGRFPDDARGCGGSRLCRLLGARHHGHRAGGRAVAQRAFLAFDLARRRGCRWCSTSITAPTAGLGGKEAAEVCGRAAALCDIVVGNDEEFGVLAGRRQRLEPGARSGPAGAQHCRLQDGRAGRDHHAAGATIRTGIYPTRALKPTGAGDAFLGALLAARAAGRP